MIQTAQKKRIGVRLAVYMIVAALVPLVFFGLFSYLSARDYLIDAASAQLQLRTKSIAKQMDAYIQQFDDDATFLSHMPPIQGYIRSLENGGIDPKDGATTEQLKNRLGDIFLQKAASHDDYLQIRYIDESGQEIVRVNDAPGVPPTRVSDDALQNKSNQYYFVEAMQLQEGEKYVSELDLNKEGQPPTVVIPYEPVIRYAVPVFSEIDQSRKGILVVNIHAESLFQTLEAQGESTPLSVTPLGKTKQYFLNSSGYYFVNPNPALEWGSERDLHTGHSIFDDFSPEIASRIISGNEGVLFLEDQGIFLSYEPIFPDQYNEQNFWIVFEMLPKDILLAPVRQLSHLLLISIVGFSLAALLYALLISFSFTKPLHRLSQVAAAIQKGNLLARARTTAQDEFGELTKVFNAMADSILEERALLNQRVEEKTLALEERLQESDKTRKAITNILHDVELQKQDLVNTQNATFNLMEDISEEKEKVTAEKDKINAILHSIGDGVFVIDRDLRIFMYNRAAEQIIGYPSKEAIGKVYKDIVVFVSEKESIPEDVFITSSLATSSTREIPLHCAVLNKDGEKIPVYAKASPLMNKRNEVMGSVVVFRDITKEQSIDRAKSEFVSLASHQLRTPLSTINWYAEMLISGDAGDVTEQQKEFLHEIYNGNQRMVALVNSLLNVSRLELGTFSVTTEPLTIDTEAKAVINDLKPKVAEKKQKIRTHFDTAIGTIQADPKLLNIIFLNLLSNAVKYTPENGTISLDISLGKNTLPTHEKEPNAIHIKVRDNGYGIPKKQHDKIFTKLFRADNVVQMDTEGTGLGLYIVKQIVEHVGGRISFTSKINKGTTFHIELPRKGMENKKGTKTLN